MLVLRARPRDTNPKGQPVLTLSGVAPEDVDQPVGRRSASSKKASGWSRARRGQHSPFAAGQVPAVERIIHTCSRVRIEIIGPNRGMNAL